MFGRKNNALIILALLAGLLAAGCATQGQYASPYTQEEDPSRAYRTLYPNPFTLEQGPSATSNGDE